ncbi:Protein CBG03539 [Caenorhabditis briggsae]|uniref:Protein CBG03539 n=1 Tax=Caenorhabditis briggsae TaxID=6238 RepID=A8WVA5_CAEBR|nr:Protein CBG03539 [Caenorhabditis briggsae]CAP24416.1 Protein CBG03539 [Caenorhabditis briggsae]
MVTAPYQDNISIFLSVFVFIMKVFINSRAVFMSEKPKMTDHNHAGFHLMYRKVLLDKCHQGSAPSDRQCHSCHRIGHFYESCPFRMQGKDNRRRYTSNSTNNSYRSNDGFNNHRKTSEDSNGVGDRLGYHKRVKISFQVFFVLRIIHMVNDPTNNLLIHHAQTGS